MPNNDENVTKTDLSTELSTSHSSGIQTNEPRKNLPQSITPGELLKIAVESGADLDKLDKLMELQERHEKREALKLFNEAITNFQKEVPRIVKRKDGHGYNYAPLGDITAQIKDTAAKFGLSWKWTNSFIDRESVLVTFHVRHVAGHVEPTEVKMFVEEPNKMQSRNQMVGIAITYGQRYSLIGGLGLSTADEDMDGRVDNEYKKKSPYTQFRADEKTIRESMEKGFTAESVVTQLERDYKVSDVVKSKIYAMEKDVNPQVTDGAKNHD